MLETREARYFIAVAEELHFGRAAERLRMSQPPLSQVIKALERRLGVQLLHRTTREVRLTPAGSVFLDRCRTVVGAAEAADTAARAAADGQAGELRIGAVTSAILHPLHAALARFRAEHPRVDVRVEETDTHLAVQAIRHREIDVALVRQLATPPDCVRLTLRTERFVLALPEAWATSLDLRGSLAAAADLPWIWLPRAISPDYHDQVAACCRAAGFTPDARHTARSITSQLTMVASGLGVALVPASATVPPVLPPTTPTGAGIYVAEFHDPATVDLAAVWRRDTNPLVDGLIHSARAVIDEGRRA